MKTLINKLEHSPFTYLAIIALAWSLALYFATDTKSTTVETYIKSQHD